MKVFEKLMLSVSSIIVGPETGASRHPKRSSGRISEGRIPRRQLLDHSLQTTKRSPDRR